MIIPMKEEEKARNKIPEPQGSGTGLPRGGQRGPRGKRVKKKKERSPPKEKDVPKGWDVDDGIPVRSDHKTVATREAEGRGGGSTGPHPKAE